MTSYENTVVLTMWFMTADFSIVYKLSKAFVINAVPYFIKASLINVNQGYVLGERKNSSQPPGPRMWAVYYYTVVERELVFLRVSSTHVAMKSNFINWPYNFIYENIYMNILK